MKTKSKLKTHKKIILLSSLVGLVCVGLGVLAYKSVKPPQCIDVIRNAADNNNRKMIMPNRDGGVFLLLQEETGGVRFIGYIGPKSAESLAEDMAKSGLLQIRVENTGQCEAESGLIYTVVEGNYMIAEHAPESHGPT